MLKSLKIKNFTAFVEAELRFSKGLNVFVGENGTGKTHLLKLPYSVTVACTKPGAATKLRPTKAALQRRIADKLVNVMRPEALGRLARRQRGRQRCEVALAFGGRGADVAFNFATQTKSEVVLDSVPANWLRQRAVFLPTRELLSIYPGFSALYDTHHLEFEETWRDTCQLLGAPTSRGRREEEARALLQPLEGLMGGLLLLDRNGRFYLKTQQGTMEMPLVAEGLRKLGMLARLVATGSFAGPASLFWDEPETNLNPKLIKGVAAALLTLAAQGVQVFVATHSLFLLRELDILRAGPDHGGASCRYFALSAPGEMTSEADGGVRVEQGGSLEDVDPFVSLDENLEQADRYLDLHVG